MAAAAASRGLRLLALAALARGEPAAGDGLASCRSTLAGLRTRAKFEVAALCRASLPTDICKQAMQELGPAPWSSESVHSACSRWESEWAPAMHMKGRTLESVVLDNVTGTKAPTPVPTPWQDPSPGINAFNVPGLLLSKANISASDMKKFPESMPPEAVVGNLKMMVGEIVPIPHDLPFQKAVTKEVARLAGVDPSKLRFTSVELHPELDDLGVPKISGEVQVFFVITGEDAADAAKIAKTLQSAKKRVLSYRMWRDMTAGGSNQHSLLIESLDARSASDDEEPEKPPPSASEGKGGAGKARTVAERVQRLTTKLASAAISKLQDRAKSIKNATADLAENVTDATAAKVGKAKEQAKKIKNATAELADNVTEAATTKVGKAKEAKHITNATAKLAENVANATVAKASKAKDQLEDAVKGFGDLLGKKPTLMRAGKAEDVLDDAEVQGGSVAKDGLESATASWATMLLAAAAVCSMAVLVAGKLWRRRVVSQRTVASRGRSSVYDSDDCEGLE